MLFNTLDLKIQIFFFSFFHFVNHPKMILWSNSQQVMEAGAFLFYLPLHSLISHQRPISAHKDPGRLRWPQVTSARVSSCAQRRFMAYNKPKVNKRGGEERGDDGKRDFF